MVNWKEVGMKALVAGVAGAALELSLLQKLDKVTLVAALSSAGLRAIVNISMTLYSELNSTKKTTQVKNNSWLRYF